MDAPGAFSSQITFLNFRDFSAGTRFLSQVLQLEPVYTLDWAVVYRIADGACLGAVDHSRSSVPAGPQDGILISLTTHEIEAWHRRICAALGDAVSPIRALPDAGLKSFFFTGPEGFRFEIQQFVLPQLQKLF